MRSAELTQHLGYDKHDPAGHGSRNSRNGSTPKTVLTEVGPVPLDVPRDRAGTFPRPWCRKGNAGWVGCHPFTPDCASLPRMCRWPRKNTARGTITMMTETASIDV